MKPKNVLNDILIRLYTLVFVIQLIVTPASVFAQSTDPIQTRKDEAAALKAEAEARKAVADAAKAEADAAKQQLDNRKTQLDLARSTTTIEGNLVENNIAASKAIGCAAVNIAREIQRLDAHERVDMLVLYSQLSAAGLSEYTALRTQFENINGSYDKAIDAVKRKLAEYEASESKKSAAEIEKIKKELAQLETEVQRLRSPRTARSATRVSRSLAAESGFRTFKLEAEKTIESRTSSFALAGDPVGTALNLIALFKTDTTVKGVDAKPGSQDLTGYLFRLLKLRLKEVTDPRGGIVFAGGPKIISPDHIVFSEAPNTDSGLLFLVKTMSTKYMAGNRAAASVAARRKDVIALAELAVDKKKLESDIKVAEEALSKALKDYAANQTNLILKARYEQAIVEAKLAGAKLAMGQKAIDKRGAEFDEFISKELTNLESLNAVAEALAKKLGAGSGDASGSQKLLGDHLRYEVLYDSLHTPVLIPGSSIKRTPNVLWLETGITANGANQMKKSSIVIDIFRQGPSISYSGGSVVSYQLRTSAGEIKMAGTAWAFAPYRKSGSITKFECQGITDNGVSRPFNNP